MSQVNRDVIFIYNNNNNNNMLRIWGVTEVV
jgi:hypothetical protein